MPGLFAGPSQRATATTVDPDQRVSALSHRHTSSAAQQGRQLLPVRARAALSSTSYQDPLRPRQQAPPVTLRTPRQRYRPWRTARPHCPHMSVAPDRSGDRTQGQAGPTDGPSSSDVPLCSSSDSLSRPRVPQRRAPSYPRGGGHPDHPDSLRSSRLTLPSSRGHAPGCHPPTRVIHASDFFFHTGRRHLVTFPDG